MDSSLQVIEVGETFSLTISEAGKVFAWGTNDFFEMGKQNIQKDETEENSIVCLPLENGIKPRKVSNLLKTKINL